MSRSQEISKLIKQMEPMFNRFGELTKEEVDEVGTLFAQWMELNNQRYCELQDIQNRTSKEVTALKEIVDEYKVPCDLMEIFILEKGLYEEYLVFSDEVIQEFYKNKKSNLTLVKG